MSEAKYGRLFTEEDVLRILRYGADRDWSEILEEFDGPGGRGLTFPGDEPLLLLRGQDKAAPDAIYAPAGNELDYYSSAGAQGASQEYLDAIRERGWVMREWQAAHPDRVKVPD